MEFVAIDVETANADMSSICQIGLAMYQDGKLVDEWQSYIDPKDYFDEINISIHGINEKTIKGAPVIADIAHEIYRLLDGRISVCHTHFDRIAIRQAFEKFKLRQPSCSWLDSARVTRRTWEEFAQRGYGLGNVCAALGYKFNHHDALEDAKAAAFVLNTAIQKTGFNLDAWLRLVNQPIDPGTLGTGHALTREGNPNGFLHDEVLVFTGELKIPRREAVEMAGQAGCRVDERVTKKTTILVVGDQDMQKLAGNEKSSKHRKAEELISTGHMIQILGETDFFELVKLSD